MGGYQRDRGFLGALKVRSQSAFWFVAFPRAEEVFWSDGGSTGWFPHSWDTAEVSNISDFETVTNKRTITWRRLIFEEYAEVRVLVHAGSGLLTVADARSQFAEMDGQGDNGVEDDKGG